MISRRALIRGAGAVGITGLAGCISDNDSGTALTFSGVLPESNNNVQYSLIPFTEKVEERTDGEITFEMHYDGALGDSGSQIELLNSGAADIAFVGPAYLSDQIPLSDVFSLPGTAPSSKEGTPIMWEMLNGTLYDVELQELNLKPVACALPAPYQVSTVGSAIETRNDWDGADIRSSGGIMSITLETLGANPVEIEGADLYQALERGTVGGTAYPIPSIQVYDVGSLLNYCSTNINLGSFTVAWMMNDEIWNGLSDEHQEIMSEAGREAAIEAAESHDTDHTEIAQTLEEEEGVEMYEVSEDEWADWQQDLREQVGQEWVSQIDNSNAQDILDEWAEAF